MLIFEIKRQSKNLHVKSKIWQSGYNQLWNNIHIDMGDKATTKGGASEIDLILPYYHI